MKSTFPFFPPFFFAQSPISIISFPELRPFKNLSLSSSSREFKVVLQGSLKIFNFPTTFFNPFHTEMNPVRKMSLHCGSGRSIRGLAVKFRGFLILEEHRQGHGMTKFQTFHMKEILPKTFYMMGILFFPCTGFFLLAGFFVGVSFILVVVGVLTFFVIGLAAVFLVIYIRELISNDNRHPVAGPIFNLLIHFNRLFNYQTSLARKYSTYRLITPFKSDQGHTVYGKGKFNSNLMRDLFGDGIFAEDGEKWHHQRKLASYEFSTKVLRDFSATVFRTNAAKLASDVSIAATTKQMIDLQDLLVKSTLDSIFKVGFGVELNTLSGSDEFSTPFMKAFDDSNVIVYWRYVDLLWKIKRFLNIGLEADLKQNIKRGKEDILSRFLMESAKDPEKMTDKYLRDISLNFIIAEKIAQEVREATEAEDNISTDEFANKLTEAALEKMWYLHAALTETLRLHPAVPVDGKNSEEDDILPDGFKVKKGDGVNYMAYAMGRISYIW
ncbi:unnamed protein product [Camellia sinensis]